MLPITHCIMMLTDQCNMRCKYCFEERQVSRMSLQVAKDTIDFLQRTNPDHAQICLFGGEPMLEFDSIIVPLMDYIHSKPIPTRVGMTTNGTLLTKERVDFLHENNIGFMISMDGPKFIQDNTRPLANGKSSYDLLMQNIPYILQVNPRNSVRATIATENLKYLYETIMFFEETGFRVIGILPDLFAEWTDKNVEEFTDSVKAYEESLIIRYERGEHPPVFSGMVDAFARLWALSKVKQRRATIHCQPDCQCGFGCRSSASIATNGDIFGCHHPDLHRNGMWHLGNIYDGVDEEKVNALVALYDPMRLGNDMCETCPLDPVCEGGCKPNNFVLNGDVNIVPKSYCYWTRILTDSAYRIMVRLKNKNEIFDRDFEHFKFAERY